MRNRLSIYFQVIGFKLSGTLFKVFVFCYCLQITMVINGPDYSELFFQKPRFNSIYKFEMLIKAFQIKKKYPILGIF